MSGTEIKQSTMFSYVSQEDRIAENHPMRKLKEMIDPLLEKMSPHFNAMYSDVGRSSIPPEYLLRASLVQVLYTIRSERLLMEQLDYNLLFRWFVGLSMDDAVWDHSVFSKNRDRLLEADIATKFLKNVLDLARSHQLLSDEHFTVDGTLIEAWAGQKSFVKKDTPRSNKSDDSGNPTVDFHGEKRTNDTHQSTTDPEARLYRKGKGKESKLSFMGHVVMDNRHGLVVSTCYTKATGKAERTTATQMMKKVKGKQTRRLTLGADKNYDTKEFVDDMRSLKITLHAAQNTKRRGGSAIDERTTRHPGYQISQWKRKIVEEIFGWIKTIGPMRKTKHKGVERGGWMFTFTNAVYNLIRIRNIIGATG
ncbi:MAG: IS5 family transposase [Ignavibacteria bacterium]|nr:IS5 family transposase [Ignavibacteria bacterium]